MVKFESPRNDTYLTVSDVIKDLAKKVLDAEPSSGAGRLGITSNNQAQPCRY